MLGLVDVAIMGHLDSSVYVGAIGLGSIIFNFLYMGFGFLRMGTSGFTAQARGQRNFSEALAILFRGLLVALGAGLLFVILQWPIDKLSFFLLDGSSEVKEFARQYFYIRIWAAPAALSVMVFNGWFLGLQNARFPMIVTILINVVNIGLNFLFVYGFGMKSDGVALATLISQYTGLLCSFLLFFIYYKRLFKYFNKALLRSKQAFKKFLRVNTDILIRTLCIIFVLSFFTSASARQGDTILAVNQLLLQFFYLFSYFIDGLANAAEALTGKQIGAGNKTGLRKMLKIIFTWATTLSLLFSASYYFGGSILFKMLTNQAALIEAVKPYYIWIALIPLSTFVAFIWDGVFIGATASKSMRNTLLLSTIAFLLSYYLLLPVWPYLAIWIALHVFMLMRGVLLSRLAPKEILR